jgi:hypothetical protein
MAMGALEQAICEHAPNMPMSLMLHPQSGRKTAFHNELYLERSLGSLIGLARRGISLDPNQEGCLPRLSQRYCVSACWESKLASGIVRGTPHHFGHI